MLEDRERLVELFGIMITEFKIGAAQIRILQVGFHGPHAATLIAEAGAAAPAALSAAVPPQLQPRHSPRFSSLGSASGCVF
jgi:hypothetical protein